MTIDSRVVKVYICEMSQELPTTALFELRVWIDPTGILIQRYNRKFWWIYDGDRHQFIGFWVKSWGIWDDIFNSRANRYYWYWIG